MTGGVSANREKTSQTILLRILAEATGMKSGCSPSPVAFPFPSQSVFAMDATHLDFPSRIDRYLGAQPRIAPTAYVAAGAVVIGDVTLGEESSVWFSTVLRADIHRIVIGPRSNVQDGAVVHLADEYGAFVGELVTIGHKAVLHACTIDNEVLIGMGAIVLDGAEIGPRCIVGAGALVTGKTKIPSGSLVLGSPAKVVRTLSADEQKGIRVWADRYVELSRIYRERNPQPHGP
jgi:carbonic anhydrase/acetyltransferase-like protein (isoleucine patch superfamily)